MAVERYILIGGRAYRVTEEVPGQVCVLDGLWDRSPAERPRRYKATSDALEGLACDCEDWEYRSHREPMGCKHTRALVKAGLLRNPWRRSGGSSAAGSRVGSG